MTNKKGKRNKKRVPRECLRCGRVFMSEGNFNRICPSCNQINANIAMPTFEVLDTRYRNIFTRW
jgi:Zn finger protein HypA/HybF involved in hydrogenase expression